MRQQEAGAQRCALADFGTRQDGVFCAFADGSVQRLDPQVTVDVVRAWLTRNGGEAVPRP
jgi:hypothetical protein